MSFSINGLVSAPALAAFTPPKEAMLVVEEGGRQAPVAGGRGAPQEQSLQQAQLAAQKFALRLAQVGDAAKAVGSIPLAGAELASPQGRHAEGLVLSGAVQRLQAAVQSCEVQEHLLSAQLQVLRSQADTDDLQRQVSPRAESSGFAAKPPAASKPGFFDDLIKMTDSIKDDYLSLYERMLKAYSDFYKKFNEQVMAKMAEHIRPYGDKGELIIDAVILGGLITRLEEALTFTVKPSEYKKWEKWVKENGGTFSGGRVRLPNTTSAMYWGLDKLLRENKFSEGAVGGIVTQAKVDPAVFQAWQTGFNSLESELKNQLQLFSTKYGSANSYYENFNRILSTQLGQYGDMLKNMAAAIA